MKNNKETQSIISGINQWIVKGLELKVEHDFDINVVNERAIQLQCIALKNIDALFKELLHSESYTKGAKQ